MVEKHPVFGDAHMGYSWAILFLRKKDSALEAWDIPVKNGSVGMPDLKWWRPTYECKEFGPSFVGVNINEQAPIKCHDQEIPEWWASEWQWNINGKSLGKMVEDMAPTNGTLEGKYFVVGKPRKRS